jgi:F-type H+-transporting ATPase subunit c
MDSKTIIAVCSIATAGITIGIGSIAPALGEGRSVATALTSLAQQPEASATILIFANPFWTNALSQAGGK